MTEQVTSDKLRLAIADALYEIAIDIELGEYEQLTQTTDKIAKTKTITVVRKGVSATIIFPLEA